MAGVTGPPLDQGGLRVGVASHLQLTYTESAATRTSNRLVPVRVSSPFRVDRLQSATCGCSRPSGSGNRNSASNLLRALKRSFTRHWWGGIDPISRCRRVEAIAHAVDRGDAVVIGAHRLQLAPQVLHMRVDGAVAHVAQVAMGAVQQLGA